jgi:hypothetical protein
MGNAEWNHTAVSCGSGGINGARQRIEPVDVKNADKSRQMQMTECITDHGAATVEMTIFTLFRQFYSAVSG